MRPISANKKEAGGSTVHMFSAAVVECGTSPGGAAEAISKKGKEFELFARSGKRSSLVDVMHARIHYNQWRGGHWNE